MRKLTLALCVWGAALCAPLALHAQALQAPIFFHGVSAANTAQSFIYDSISTHDTLAINASCSAGTATLVVKVDQVSAADTASQITIDSISAASPQVKQYTATTVGATTALSPLSFRWITITIGTCGSSNTSTLDVGMK